MSKQLIRVAGIKDTKNPDYKQLELRTTIEKPAAANPIGFFIQGGPNTSRNTEERVAWQTVSAAFIAKFNLSTATTDFASAVGTEAMIVARESFTPLRQSYDTNGNLTAQKPKRLPNTSHDVYLTKDGQPIYRNTELTVQPEEFYDVLIQHDKLPREVLDMVNQERASRVNVSSASGIVTEPTLD